MDPATIVIASLVSLLPSLFGGGKKNQPTQTQTTTSPPSDADPMRPVYRDYLMKLLLGNQSLMSGAGMPGGASFNMGSFLPDLLGVIDKGWPSTIGYLNDGSKRIRDDAVQQILGKAGGLFGGLPKPKWG